MRSQNGISDSHARFACNVPIHYSIECGPAMGPVNVAVLHSLQYSTRV